MTILEGELFNRRAAISVGSVGVVNEEDGIDNSLRVTFNVERSLKPEPNTVELSVWNLNADNRAALEDAEDISVEISAGYINNVFLIFSGDLRQAISMREGADIVTKIESGDGEKKFIKGRINKTFSAGTTTTAIMEALAAALDVGPGNLADVALPSPKLGGTGGTFVSGTTISGQAAQELTTFTESIGVEWSIQNGNLLFLENGKPVSVLAKRVSSDTGLIGVPTVDNKGILKARTLMLPDIEVGRVLDVKAERIKGAYRIEKAKYFGDTRGQDWYIDVEGKRL